MIKKRIGILTGGGDVPPLNIVLSTVLEKSKVKNTEVYGFLYGWQGLLENNYVKLSKLKIPQNIGGTLLKSSRVNLKNIIDAKDIITRRIDELKLDGLIIIGGEDTLSNSLLIKNIPQVLISKTIDNDVGINRKGEIVNYFTLGYPTAAEKISSYVSLNEGLRTTAYSHERIIIVESMGMHAGWLALSSCLGHPDFIIIPEFPVEYEELLGKIITRFKLQKNLIIVIAEGARWKNGSYISADENEKDSFGHPKFKGAAEILAKRLKEDLKKIFETRNINSVNPSYLYRSGSPNKLDSTCAKKLGIKAVNLINRKISEPIFLSIKKDKDLFTTEEYPVTRFESIEEFHRFVDKRFYNPEEFKVTKAGRKYLSSFIRELSNPVYGLK